MQSVVIKRLRSYIDTSCLGVPFFLEVHEDKKYGGRLYLQYSYSARCVKTGNKQNFRSRKWYLSSYMTEDEVIKTAYTAFEAAVKHEIMEGFKVDGTILFNPHVSYKELLKISKKEVKRK